MMTDDPIVEEVRQARQQHAAKFNYDLQAIFQDLKQQEAASDLNLVRFPPRKRHGYGTPRPTQPALSTTVESVPT